MADKETLRYSQPQISTKGTKSVDTHKKERHLWVAVDAGIRPKKQHFPDKREKWLPK